MKRNTDGFYTVEAAILVPLVLLTVLSFGMIIRAESVWENCIHCAADETCAAAAVSYRTASAPLLPFQIRSRIRKENPQLQEIAVRSFRTDFAEHGLDHLTEYRLETSFRFSLPAGFFRDMKRAATIRYRGFTGTQVGDGGLGKEGLENGIPEDPVLIFPQLGQKYHRENCSYVRASFQPVRLDRKIRSVHSSCGVCHSEQQKDGAIVFCFPDSDTAYHLGSCRILEKHTILMDRTEAEGRGFSPCSRCIGANP